MKLKLRFLFKNKIRPGLMLYASICTVTTKIYTWKKKQHVTCLKKYLTYFPVVSYYVFTIHTEVYNLLYFEQCLHHFRCVCALYTAGNVTIKRTSYRLHFLKRQSCNIALHIICPNLGDQRCSWLNMIALHSRQTMHNGTGLTDGKTGGQVDDGHASCLSHSSIIIYTCGVRA